MTLIIVSRRKSEMKGRAWTFVLRCPEISAMRLYDGSTDREPQPYSPVLGAYKRVEDAIRVSRIEADAGVPHRNHQLRRLTISGSDQHFTRLPPGPSHGLTTVENQIKQHLLQLDTVAQQGREIFGQVRR